MTITVLGSELGWAYIKTVLAFANPKYVCPTLPTRTLGRRLPVLHLDILGAFNLHFLSALHAIRSHNNTSL